MKTMRVVPSLMSGCASPAPVQNKKQMETIKLYLSSFATSSTSSCASTEAAIESGLLLKGLLG